MKKPLQTPLNNKDKTKKPLLRTKILANSNPTKLPQKEVDVPTILFMDYYTTVHNSVKVPAFYELETVRDVLKVLVNSKNPKKNYKTIAELLTAINSAKREKVAKTTVTTPEITTFTFFRNFILKLASQEKKTWKKIKAENNIETTILRLLIEHDKCEK